MKKGIEIFGKKYESMKSAAEANGLKYQKFWDRLKRTKNLQLFDTELLVSITDLTKIHLILVGLDGQARYRVPWEKDLQTTRQVIAHERPDLLDLYNKANPNGEFNPYRRE